MLVGPPEPSMGVTEVHKTYDIGPFQDAPLKTGRLIGNFSFASHSDE